ncbi:hypothetical protein BHE74_00039827 [Ensete ventricosum]|nr:hypothetical protein BHE74_00039827 [Ensete ventricosum]
MVEEREAGLAKWQQTRRQKKRSYGRRKNPRSKEGAEDMKGSRIKLKQPPHLLPRRKNSLQLKANNDKKMNQREERERVDSLEGALEPNCSLHVAFHLLCLLYMFSSECVNSPESVGTRTSGAGWSFLGDLRPKRWSVCPSGRLGADDPAHRPFREWEG